MKKILFIEGKAGKKQPTLRAGFSELLRKCNRLEYPPSIKMGDGIDQTIRKFKVHSGPEEKHLLIDLDGKPETKTQLINKKNLSGYSDQVFCMIQEMEAWFLSQPAVVEKVFGAEVAKKLPKTKTPQNILKPGLEFYKISGKRYHKVRHGTKLLTLLDPNQLEKDFPEFANLINALLK